MPDLFSTSFLTCAVIACIAGMVRGFAGFGAAMIMTPIFSGFYGPGVGVALCLLLEIGVALPVVRVGVALCLLLEIAVALPVVPGVVRLVDWHRIGLLLVAAALGVPVGNVVLTQ